MRIVYGMVTSYGTKLSLVLMLSVSATLVTTFPLLIACQGDPNSKRDVDWLNPSGAPSPLIADQQTAPDLESTPSPEICPSDTESTGTTQQDSTPQKQGDDDQTDVEITGTSNKCDDNDDHSCIRATDVIIYTTSGEAIFSDEAVSEEARAQNNQLKIKLEAIVEKNRADAVLGSNLGLRSSRTDFWDISFFVVPLTPPQVQEVQQMANVEIIVPNNAANVDGPTSANLAEQPVNAAPRRKRRKLEKRDDRLYRDEAAWEDLRFVSTPGQVELSERFSYYKNDDSYYENGAQRVTIILIGGGVRRDHDEFRSGGRNLISMYMNGMDADILQDDYTGVGTCLASKLVSPNYGVGKDMEMIIAKVAGTIGSLLNMLENIIWFFKGLKKEGRQIKGYYVLTMGSHWPDPKDYSSTRLQRIIRLLLVRYEVVVVVAAGEDRTRSFAPIDEIPGIFSTRAGTRDLITVGAVTSDGRVCPWSKGGDALSILAPGYVLCASYKGPNENQLDLGTNVATIQTASLAGYYLSRRQIGYLIRQDPAGVPHAAKAWIKTNSQERIMGNRVIWNMLGDHLT